jgi:hypothetical protein
MVGIPILKTGLVPTKNTALGIEFGEDDQQTFLFLLGLVVVYFLAAFLIYAASDFLAWWEVYRVARAEIEEPEMKLYEELAKKRDEIRRASGETPGPHGEMPERISEELEAAIPFLTSLDRTRRTGLVFASIRALFEYLLRILVGAYAAYILLF